MAGSNYFGQPYFGQGYAGLFGIQFDATANSGYQAASGSYSWTHVTGVGARQILVVSVGLLSVTNSVTALTYNGVALTKLRSDVSVSGTVRTEIWYLVDPPQGSHSVSITLNTASVSAAASTTYNNVDPNSPVDAQNGGTGVTGAGGGSASVSTTTVTNGAWIVDAAATPTTFTVGSNQRQTANINGAVGSVGQSHKGAIVTAGATTMQWNNIAALTSWTMSTFAMKPKTSATIYLSALTGSLTFTGSFTKSIGYPLTASLSFVGAVVKSVARKFTGSLSFSGAWSSLHQHFASFTGSLSFTGAITKQTSKFMTGSLTFIGSFTRLANYLLTGSLSFVGNLSRQVARGFTGSLTFAGNLAKLTKRTFTGSLSFSGAIVRQITRPLTASLSFVGAINRSVSRAFTASLSFTGKLLKITSRPFTASLSFVGNINKLTSRAFTATVSFIGLLRHYNIYIVLSSTLSFVGSINRQSRRTFTATLSFTGSLITAIIKAFNKILNATHWRPGSGKGFVLPSGTLKIVTKAGLTIVTKSGLFVIENPTYVVPQYPVSWTKTGKNQTQWRPTSGFGQVLPTGVLKIITKAGLIIVNKAGLNVVENPSYVVPKTATTWAKSAKNSSQWRPSTVLPTGSLRIVTKSGLALVNKAGLFVIENPTYVKPKSATVWNPSGA